jgi:choline kinase/phosphatidylglycerophosphate synthase/phosphoglycolate phosphatase-like HAD superfamily hydrolase
MREGQAVGAVWRRPRSRGVSGEGVPATAPPDSSLPPRIDERSPLQPRFDDDHGRPHDVVAGKVRPPTICVILAAGRGSRLAGGAGLKPLLPVLGLPLLERTIVTASEAGLSEFFVVTGCQAPRLESFLSELGLRRNLEISAIRNETWEAGNASSLLAARHVLDEDFVLLVADHVFDPAILRRLLGQHLEEGEIILAVDFRVDDSALVDVEEATKVSVRGQWVAAIGKELWEYDALDTGIFLCSPAILPAFEVNVGEGDDSLAGGVRRLAEQCRARVLDIGAHSWVDIDTAGDLRKARLLLSRSLAKPNDGLVSRTINRKLSGRLLTPLLLRLAPGVSANQVSALAFAAAIGAAAAFLLGNPVIGGLAVQLASVLDGCDGEIARLKKEESRFGSFFDAVLDRYADTFLLAGAGYYAWSAGDQSVLFGPYWSPTVVLVSILAAAGNLLQSYTSAKSVADLGYRYGGGLTAAGRGRDLRLFVLFLGGVLASVDPSAVLLALLFVALATNAVVVARTWTSWRLAQPAPPFVNASALIFDFDGTIADTMPFLTKLAVDLLTEHYPVEPAAARRRYLETVGVDFRSQLEELFPGHPENDAVAAAFEADKRAGILDCPVFSDVVQILELLDRQGVTRFVCSSTTRELVVSYLRRRALEARFEDCLGYEPGLAKTKQVKLILARHELDPREVVFVGDAPRDRELLRGTGVRFVGIHRLFDAGEFRRRGILSVDGLAGLTRSWNRFERLDRRTEPPPGPRPR